jgi:hypothetical protein
MPTVDTSELIRNMMFELRLIRSIMEAQLTGQAEAKYTAILDKAPLLGKYWEEKSTK